MRESGQPALDFNVAIAADPGPVADPLVCPKCGHAHEMHVSFMGLGCLEIMEPDGQGGFNFCFCGGDDARG